MRSLARDITVLCTVARVSRSGYYQWLQKSHEPEKDHNDYLLIKEIFDKGRARYGFRTIQMKLRSDWQIVMNHKKITRIMKKYNLATRIRRVNPYHMIMKKSGEHRTVANTLDRAFRQTTPRTVFCTDITYLPFKSTMAYFSAIKDVASREIVGWQLSRNITMSIVMKTLEHMKAHATSLEGSIIHSDQGVHYTNPRYMAMIKELHMIQSMSRKGNCLDNAPIESFFDHLKDDVDYQSCKTFEELQVRIEEYVQYYNNERYQWGLKKMTPVQYRDHLLKTPG